MWDWWCLQSKVDLNLEHKGEWLKKVLNIRGESFKRNYGVRLVGGRNIARLFGFINWVDNVSWLSQSFFKVTIQALKKGYDAEMTHKMTALETIYGNQYTSSTQLMKIWMIKKIRKP